MNQESRLISVVMPTYNHARFIGKSVESVLGQSYGNFELKIVDNYFQDNTEEIVAAYADPRIRYVKFPAKGVVAAARNYGISLAKGEYVAFLDSDDLWLPEKLGTQLEAFGRGGDVAMVYSRFRTITGDTVSEQVLPKVQRCLSGAIFRDLYLRHFIACSGVMVRKNILEQLGGFDESPALVVVEDVDLWLKIALAGQIRCASEHPLFLYRIHAANLSRGHFKKYKRAIMLAGKYYSHAGFGSFGKAIVLATGSVIKQKLAAIFQRPA